MNTTILPVMRYRAWLRVEHYLHLLTADFAEQYGKTELIEGEVLQMNAQFARHAYAKSLLHLAIDRGLRAIGSPLVVVVEASVAMLPFDLPEPDLVVTAAPRVGGPLSGNDVVLIVEVADTTQRYDLGRKASVYARNRVPEYWVVDLAAMTIVRHWDPDAGGYAATDITAIGEVVAAMTIDNLAVATAEMLALPEQDG